MCPNTFAAARGAPLEGEEIGFDHVLFEATRYFPDEYAQARALSLEARPVIRELGAVVDECEAEVVVIHTAYAAYDAITSLQPPCTWEWREEAISTARRLRNSLGSLQLKLNMVCEKLAEIGTQILPEYRFVKSLWGAELAAMDRGPAMIAALFPSTFRDIKQVAARAQRVVPVTRAAASGDFRRFHRVMRKERRID